MKRILLLALMFTCFATARNAVALTPAVSNGLSYLTSTQNADGSWTGIITSSAHSIVDPVFRTMV
jgi:hypothetical protein